MLAKCGNGMVQKLKKRFLSDGEVRRESRSPFLAALGNHIKPWEIGTLIKRL